MRHAQRFNVMLNRLPPVINRLAKRPLSLPLQQKIIQVGVKAKLGGVHVSSF
jgi:hypothetical protein